MNLKTAGIDMLLPVTSCTFTPVINGSAEFRASQDQNCFKSFSFLISLILEDKQNNSTGAEWDLIQNSMTHK